MALDEKYSDEDKKNLQQIKLAILYDDIDKIKSLINKSKLDLLRKRFNFGIPAKAKIEKQIMFREPLFYAINKGSENVVAYLLDICEKDDLLTISKMKFSIVHCIVWTYSNRKDLREKLVAILEKVVSTVDRIAEKSVSMSFPSALLATSYLQYFFPKSR